MKFETYTPCEILKPYIRCFAVQEAAHSGIYKVLPDTSPVIGFQYKGALSWLQDEREIRLASSGITGLRDVYRAFKNSPDIGTILVFFKEGGAAAFFREPLHEFFGESAALRDFIPGPEIQEVEARLHEAKSDPMRIRIIEKFLISRLSSLEPDKLVNAALRLIHASKGSIRISELAGSLHISRSPLEKRFRKAVGASPKKFASIVRLKCLIESFRDGASPAELGNAAGYYDQSHFIKQFKVFTGETPEKFFADDK